jgi:hypothetical protein
VEKITFSAAFRVSFSGFRSTLGLTFLFVILSLLVGFFSVGNSLDDISREWRNQVTASLIYIWGLFLIFILVFGISSRKFGFAFPWQFYFAYFPVLILSWLISRHISPILIIGLVFYVLHFRFWRNRPTDLASIRQYAGILVAYQIVPLCLDFFEISLGRPFYWYDGFRGMTFDRVEYAFFAGLSFLLVLFAERVFNIKFWIVIIALACSLVLSQTRFVFPAIFLALVFYYRFDWRLTVGVAILIFVGGLWGVLGVRDEIFVSGREGLYFGFLEHVSDNLLSIILGASSFYQSYNDGDVPHNFLMQSVLNWGVLGLCAYFLMLAKIFFEFNWSGRALLVYLFTFGLFHPGLDAYLVTPMVALVFMFAACFGTIRSHTILINGGRSIDRP